MKNNNDHYFAMHKMNKMQIVFNTEILHIMPQWISAWAV